MARAARFLLYCIIVWAPLPLASNRPVFWAANGLACVAAAVLFVLGELSAQQRQIEWRVIAVPLTGILVSTAWMVVQVIPGMPPSLVHPIWSLVPDGANTISGSPSATWATIAQVVPIIGLAVVAVRLAVNARRGVFLLNLITLTCTVVAGYGLAAGYFGFRQVFLLDTVAYDGYLTATFVGRNAAATYFVIGLAGATALFAAHAQSKLNLIRGRRSFTLYAFEVIASGGFYIIEGLILVAAILKTGSRAGAAAAGVALFFVALLSVRTALAGRRFIWLTLAAVFCALAIVVGIAGHSLFSRLETDAGISDRLLAYEDTLRMIADRPILGHGAGAFADVFPGFHVRASSDGVWSRAHQTYLQTMAELGFPVFCLLVIAIGWILVAINREIRPGVRAPVAVAAVAATAGVAFHALLDFSVQIQAVGLTTAVLVGAGLGDALRLRTARRQFGTADHPASGPAAREVIHVTIPTSTSA